jgi:transcriptional regulator
MPSSRFPMPQGTLDMLILQAIALQPAHGYAIGQRLQEISRDAVQVNHGSLYPALHRLEQRGWIKATWQQTGNGREGKVYALTRAGQKQLAVEKATWDRLATAVKLIFDHG